MEINKVKIAEEKKPGIELNLSPENEGDLILGSAHVCNDTAQKIWVASIPAVVPITAVQDVNQRMVNAAYGHDIDGMLKALGITGIVTRAFVEGGKLLIVTEN